MGFPIVCGGRSSSSIVINRSKSKSLSKLYSSSHENEKSSNLRRAYRHKCSQKQVSCCSSKNGKLLADMSLAYTVVSMKEIYDLDNDGVYVIDNPHVLPEEDDDDDNDDNDDNAERESDFDVMVVEMTIRIKATSSSCSGCVPLASSVSSKWSTSTFILPIKRLPHSNNNNTNNNNNAAQPQEEEEATSAGVDSALLFSTDMRHMACLVPHCHCCTEKPSTSACRGSTLVVLSLDYVEDKHDITTSALPIPSFIDQPHAEEVGMDSAADTSETAPVAVAASADNAPQLQLIALEAQLLNNNINNITAIADATAAFMLAGCKDGAILAIDWKRTTLAGYLYHPKWTRLNNNHQQHPILALSYVSSSANQARLAATQHDGSILIFHTSIQPTSYNDNDELTFFKQQQIINQQHQQQQQQPSHNGDTHNNSNHATDVIPPLEAKIRHNQTSLNSDLTTHNLQQLASALTPTALLRQVSGASSKSNTNATANTSDTTTPLHANHDTNHAPHASSSSSSPRATTNMTSTDTGGLLINLTPITTLRHATPPSTTTTKPLLYEDAIWINSHTLAAIVSTNNTLYQPEEEVLFCQMYVLSCHTHDDHNHQQKEQEREGCERVVVLRSSCLKLRPHWILEEASAQFGCTVGGFGHYEQQQPCSSRENARGKDYSPGSLSLDPVTGCLAFTGSFSTNHASSRCFFACVWDWRTCTTGVVLRSSILEDTNHTTSSSTVHSSRLFFGADGYALFHLFTSSKICTTSTSDELLETFRLHTHEYTLATLSPCETRHGGFAQATPLLLFPSHVSFPTLSAASLSVQASVSPDSAVDWKETRIPSSYIATHGKAAVAAFGRKFGRSMAVASSHGVCILDLSRVKHHAAKGNFNNNNAKDHDGDEQRDVPLQRPLPCVGATYDAHARQIHPTAVRVGTGGGWMNQKRLGPKWRRFASPADERSFMVHALTWWERNSNTSNGSLDETVSEDLLLAVIELTSQSDQFIQDFSVKGGDNGVNNKCRLRLVCWSRRRLGMGEAQLLHDVDANDSTPDDFSGAILPQGIMPHAISILPAPNSCRMEGAKGAERALLTLASNGMDPACAVYQLQMTSTGRLQAKLLSVVKSDLLSDVYCTGAFVAGGFFGFDLSSSTKNKGAKVARDETMEDMAIVGFVHSGGIQAIAVDQRGISFSGSVIPQKIIGSSATSAPVKMPSSCWYSDSSGNTNSTVVISSGGRIFWIFQMTDGSTVTWSVPVWCKDLREEEEDYEMVMAPESGSTNAQNFVGFLTPVRLHHARSTNHTTQERLNALGHVSPCISNSPVCVSGTTKNIYEEIPLGPLPGSSFGCVLCVGQRARSLHNPSLGVGTRKIISFSAGNCTVAPPAFTTTMFCDMMEKEAVTVSAASSPVNEVQKVVPLSTLQQRPYDDSVALALRVLALHAVEMAYRAQKQLARTGATSSTKLSIAMGLLRQVVQCSTQVLTRLQVSSMFLGIARQLEAHHHCILFPQGDSLNDEGEHVERNGVKLTVAQLFRGATNNGSIAIAASALPLFESKYLAHRLCVDMFEHCLGAISNEYNVSPIDMQSAEERTLLRELFQYAIKLEEALQLNDVDKEAGSPVEPNANAVVQLEPSTTVGSPGVEGPAHVDERQEESDHITGNRVVSNPRESNSVVSNHVESNIGGGQGEQGEDGQGEDGVSDSTASNDSFDKISSFEEKPEDIPSVNSQLQRKERTFFSRFTSRLFSAVLQDRNDVLSPDIDRAISEAAHTFISSGFDDSFFNDEEEEEENYTSQIGGLLNGHGELSTEPMSESFQSVSPLRRRASDLSTDSPQAHENSLQDFLEKKVEFVLAEYLVTTILPGAHIQNGGGCSRWRKVASIILILKGEDPGGDEVIVPQLDATKSILDDLLGDLAAVADALQMEGSSNNLTPTLDDGLVDCNKCASRISLFISDCASETLEEASSTAILASTLSLLPNIESCIGVQIRTKLALIVLILCYASGRAHLMSLGEKAAPLLRSLEQITKETDALM